MTTLAAYHPIAPPKAERRRAAWRQALLLPRTLSAIYTATRQEYEPSILDEHLWAFWGFHQEAWDPHYRARSWPKVALGAIGPSDVVAMPAWEMALMMHVAMEIEEPIVDYSHQTGEGFRTLLPSLGRFMGKNEEQARYAADHGAPWCESPWCAEERRHANAFARMIERLAGMTPVRNNPNNPMTVNASEEDAVRLLISRQSSEWNASSIYIMLAAHAAGDLHTLIRNVVRDEIKHLAILSAAAVYLFGHRPWGRFMGLIKEAIDQFRGHHQRRSAGDHMGTNLVSALEVIVAHLLAEYRLRKWMRSVPLLTLTTVFEVPSSLPELPTPARSTGQLAQLNEALRTGRETRAGLSRWEPTQRRKALEERRFAEASTGDIERIVADQFNGFNGVGLPGSATENQIRSRINRLSSGPLRTTLLNRLRHYQIRHNRHVLARESPHVGNPD